MLATSKIANKGTPTEQKTTYNILFIIGLCHLLNDSIQAVVPAMFPILQKSIGLTFTQIGLIGFSLNIISSVMQPAVGWYTDKKPMPYALPVALTFTFFGILGLSLAPTFLTIIIAVLFIGLGSAIFHPEGSRVAYMAAGSRRGLAQSIYQVGGNSGSALGPIITAFILVPLGQFGAIWFTVVAAIAVGLLIYIAKWYSNTLESISLKPKILKASSQNNGYSRAIKIALLILVFLVFARSWYISSITNFYTFYVIEVYGYSIPQSQIFIFIFLATGAVGTFFGGPFADRFGKQKVILISMLGSAPLALILPFVTPLFAYVIVAIIGFVLMSSFSVTVVYAQELLPGKIGTMSGLIVGLAFGMGAIGSVALGSLADTFGLTNTIIAVGFLPLLGFLTLLLPNDEKVAALNA
ncbi:MFS transporter [Cytobacillus sp. S13-E01]|uniref:MFS transporter n=1 Tax=Cytobacillus sp. S13-E01 TaxID=3031326 RepID=UPI0023D7EE72|nr:MFS transporter [Cytobacillus sp. S13-E01]MDF0726285.1 MFS transporter [Cytobacillus sp. S13-E01]